MNLFGLEGVGFIISLAMTLLISGAIMFYCLRRFKILENSVVEQGKILQSFIIRQQTHLNDSNNMASSIALESARQQTLEKQTTTKIEVSDDDDDDDDEYDSDSDSEGSSVEDLKIVDEPAKAITLTTEELEDVTLQSVDTSGNLDDSVKMITVGDMTAILSVEEPLADDNSDSDSDSEPEGILEITEELEVKNNDNDNQDSDKKLKQMKVPELRELALKELSEPPENIKNMKKDQLIKLLSEK